MVAFADARKLADKTARSHMAAQLQLFPNLRDLGHESYLLHHHVWDGAVRSAMEKLNRQYHSAHFERQKVVLGPDVARSLWLQSWEFYVNCFGHHGHNALKWGVFFLYSRECCGRSSSPWPPPPPSDRSDLRPLRFSHPSSSRLRPSTHLRSPRTPTRSDPPPSAPARHSLP